MVKGYWQYVDAHGMITVVLKLYKHLNFCTSMKIISQ